MLLFFHLCSLVDLWSSHADSSKIVKDKFNSFAFLYKSNRQHNMKERFPTVRTLSLLHVGDHTKSEVDGKYTHVVNKQHAGALQNKPNPETYSFDDNAKWVLNVAVTSNNFKNGVDYNSTNKGEDAGRDVTFRNTRFHSTQGNGNLEVHCRFFS